MSCLVEYLDHGRRNITIDQAFFCGYRKTTVNPDEILVSLFIPYTTEVN